MTGGESMKYRDLNGKEYIYDTTQDKFLRLLYGTAPGRRIISRLVRPGVSEFAGRVMDSRISSLFISRFVRKNGIKLSEYVPTRYRSYNDFFTREIKTESRSFPDDVNVLASPCDGKVTAHRISDRLVMKIKGTDYSIKSLLLNRELCEEFAGGYCVIIRLSVDNYHRYAYIDDGYKTDNYYIAGLFHTVNPVAMEHNNIYYENSREYTVIDTEHFGRIVQMEVGALAVGRIVNYDGEGQIERGAEKGYFEFGGSTVVLLLKSEQVRIDDVFLKNTEEGFETFIKLGERLGCSCSGAGSAGEQA